MKCSEAATVGHSFEENARRSLLVLGKRAALACTWRPCLSDAHDFAASNNKFDKWPDCIAGKCGNGSVRSDQRITADHSQWTNGRLRK